jgi:serine/threonine protein kinase
MSSTMGALHPGSLLANRYRILSEIGQGGFATVYKGQDLALDLSMVLKKLNGRYLLLNGLRCCVALIRVKLFIKQLSVLSLPPLT